ncbi:unnamed protein product, partial [Ectocarpus sp. 6 AP-2014]
ERERERERERQAEVSYQEIYLRKKVRDDDAPLPQERHDEPHGPGDKHNPRSPGPSRCLDALAVALIQAHGDGRWRCWYTPTKQAQLASLGFCATFRRVSISLTGGARHAETSVGQR